MKDDVPRLRMFAGPNGSGKSTFKTMIRRELLGVYINPDEIEKEICSQDFLNLQAYLLETTQREILTFFQKSPLYCVCLNDSAFSLSSVEEIS